MKVDINNLRLGISGISELCHVGIMNKNNTKWLHKKEIHNDFLHSIITCWENKKQELIKDGFRYEISVKKTKITP